MTLVEMLVSLGVGSLLLTVIGTFTIFSARSFAAMANYADLEYASRNALDRLTYRIRQAQGLLDYTTNQLTFLDTTNAPFNGQPLYYRYDPQEKTLRRVSYGENIVLLKDCTYLRFDVFQRNTTNDTYDQWVVQTNKVWECKVVQVTWTCSKMLFGSKLFNTEIVQTAKIVIRNKTT
jgi:hypothetical protein